MRSRACEARGVTLSDYGPIGVRSIRIGIVDANLLSRESLTIALAGQREFALTFSVPSPDDVPPNPRIDVLLFNVRFPSEVFGEGLVLDYWRIRCPSSRIVLVTPCRAPKTIRAVVNAGVDGYAIHQAVSVSALCELVHRAYSKPPALCAETQRVLQQPPRESDLTFRELQTIQLLHVLGPSNRKSVARQLDMTVETLNVHLRNACQKLEVSGAGEVIQRCLEMGLIE